MNNISTFIKNPERILLGLLKRSGFLFSDRKFLELRYLLENKERLNLNEPKTFTEKIQWLKLYNRKPEYAMMVDKYEAKKYVASLIGEEYIIPTLGIWDKFEDIDFSKLPDRFILKATHSSHASIVCKDKRTFDIYDARKKFHRFLKTNPYIGYREWAYKNVKPRIIAEQFMENKGEKDLTDYKFFCFNGEPRYCQVIRDRSENETIDFYDTEWRHQEFTGLNPVAKTGLNPVAKTGLNPVAKPTDYSRMLKIASRLSEGMPFVRIDLYEINGKIYFGEITFYPAAGFGTFTPKEWNRKLGDMIQLPTTCRNER